MQDMQPHNLIPPGETDHEGAMAKADLYKLATYSVKLFKKLDDSTQLEAWVQAKITKAADYIASVYHYIEYEMEFSEFGAKLENSEMYSESEKLELKNKLMEAREKIAQLKMIQATKLEEGKKSPKAKKDWDKDGKIESEKDEVIGSRRRAAGLNEWETDPEEEHWAKVESWSDEIINTAIEDFGVKFPIPVESEKKLAYEIDDVWGHEVSFDTIYSIIHGYNDQVMTDNNMMESWDDDDEDDDVKRADSELKKRGVKLPKVKHKEVPVKKTKQDRDEEELDEVYGQGVYESWDDDDEDDDVKKADSELKKRGVKLPNVKHKEVPIKKSSKDKDEEKLDEISDQTKKSYRDAAGKDIQKAAKEGDKARVSKRLKGVSASLKEGSAHGWNVVHAYEKTGGDQLKITKWLRKEAGLSPDAPVYFDDADLVYGSTTIVPHALVNTKLTMQDLLDAVNKFKQTGSKGFRESIKEGSKPDFLDLDKDGNKKEPMKKAAKEKKCDESSPSAGLSAKKKSATVKKAKAGGDIGKPGKGFEKIASKAAKTYGSKEKGEKVAAAAMWKNVKRESIEEAAGVDNFTGDDLLALSKINDLETMKARAAELIQTPSRKPIKPEKVRYYLGQLENMHKPAEVIAMMYNMLLGGHGEGVIGTRYSMGKSRYHQRFDENSVNEISSDTLKNYQSKVIHRVLDKKEPLEKRRAGFDKAEKMIPKKEKGETAKSLNIDPSKVDSVKSDFKKLGANLNIKNPEHHKMASTIAKKHQSESINESAELTRMKEFLTRLNG